MLELIIEAKISPILIDGEQILGSYKSIRDYVVFTDKGVIAVNVQGITGKKKDFRLFCGNGRDPCTFHPCFVHRRLSKSKPCTTGPDMCTEGGRTGHPCTIEWKMCTECPASHLEACSQVTGHGVSSGRWSVSCYCITCYCTFAVPETALGEVYLCLAHNALASTGGSEIPNRARQTPICVPKVAGYIICASYLI